MRILFALCSLMMITACASNGLYQSPDAESAAVIKIENLIDQGGADASAPTGWVAPGSAMKTKVGLFAVDGDRLDETGGDQKVSVKAGKRNVQIFADGGGALRFKKISMKFSAGSEYMIRVKKNAEEESKFIAEVIEASAPNTIIKEVTF
ncbi:MAG: hypothetical protein P1U67_04980 [Alcanivoracaceae bacterium]|nr:hypothetical protein [Alcanivoracaceae bacterium]